jgi:aminodeoxyfutalosine synthase
MTSDFTHPSSSTATLERITEKVTRGERLTFDEGMALYHSPHLLQLGQLASWVNTQKNGDHVYFIENMTLYFTNVCEAHCAFCAFRRDEHEEGAYTLSPEDVIAYAEKHVHADVREFHITGGHNPHVPFSYYVDAIAKLKQRFPHVAIKAYTGAEIEFFSRLTGKSFHDVLLTLREAGLDTLTGGGAEVLSERYRQKMMVGKATSAQWLDVHRTAHRLGMRTHATMLYGSIETIEERMQHLVLLRELQDETQGFMVFIPLAVQPHSKTASIKRRTSAYEDLRMIAISRLMLDNFAHIKAYFINIGTQLTQLALAFGASDVHGTLIKERISHAAGANSAEGLTRSELLHLIHGAQKTAVERDTFYRVIQTYPCKPPTVRQ